MSLTKSQVVIVALVAYIALASITAYLMGPVGSKSFLPAISSGIYVICMQLCALVSGVWTLLFAIVVSVWEVLFAIVLGVRMGLCEIVAIVWAGLCDVFAGILAGLSAIVSGNWAVLPTCIESVRWAILDTKKKIFEPFYLSTLLMVVYVYVFASNREITKKVFVSMFSVVPGATAEVWEVISDPKNMLPYIIFTVILCLYPDIIERLLTQTQNNV